MVRETTRGKVPKKEDTSGIFTAVDAKETVWEDHKTVW